MHRMLLREFDEFRRVVWRHVPDDGVEGLAGFLKYWILHHMEKEDLRIRDDAYRNAPDGLS